MTPHSIYFLEFPGGTTKDRKSKTATVTVAKFRNTTVVAMATSGSDLSDDMICIARKKAHQSSPWRRGVAGEMGSYFGGSTSTGATSEDRDQLEPMLPLSTADGRSMERDGSAISLQSTHRRSASASSCSSLQSCGHLQIDEDA